MLKVPTQISTKIPKKAQLPLAFIGGVIAMLLWSTATTTGTLSANLTEAQLDARANGVIKTQKEEIARLRRIIQETSFEKPAAVNAAINNNPAETMPVAQKSVRGCVTHNDCIGIDVVCSNAVCKELRNPACGCQSNENGDYVLCISDDGSGNEARITNCDGKTCTDLPEPTCI